MLRYAKDTPSWLRSSIEDAATFHDLGKLDRDTQTRLRMGRGHALTWDHIDAGVAHLSAMNARAAAWLVRAHHSPGLPREVVHFDGGKGRRLRGRRRDNDQNDRHGEQIARTDEFLEEYVQVHSSVVGQSTVTQTGDSHGLALRLALSCLVDADHADTALFDTGRTRPAPEECKWAERLTQLGEYVRRLGGDDSAEVESRNVRRARFFEACLTSPIDAGMIACEGPVGLGKTTAVTAYLLRRARDEGLRRLIIVAPFTNILTQTAKRLRKALVLNGEDPERVIVEHHHRAEFADRDARDLAVMWDAPIVLTTAVSFFETLAASRPGDLRKLHAVPGSAIFLDEAHAALPAKLWRQVWRWLSELTGAWSCKIVFASGSLSRFWENSKIVEEPTKLPELLPREQAEDVLEAERRRVRFARLADGKVVDVAGLVTHVRASSGPRLVILNTVQNAAVVARAMRAAGLCVLHLSTALTPADRSRILQAVEVLLGSRSTDWTLVATSLVEAGVDFSFRTGFRERFSTASLIQVGGRVNRNGEYTADGGSTVYDFALDDDEITQHPATANNGGAASILLRLLRSGEINSQDPATLVTRAMAEEVVGLAQVDPLRKAELEHDYPAVSEHGRVIDSDTRLVLVDERLRERVRSFEPVSFQEVLNGSVQLWARKVESFGLPMSTRPDVYEWNDAYDPDFLGIMAGVLATKAFARSGIGIV